MFILNYFHVVNCVTTITTMTIPKLHRIISCPLLIISCSSDGWWFGVTFLTSQECHCNGQEQSNGELQHVINLKVYVIITTLMLTCGYQKVRSKNGSVMDYCYDTVNSEWCEVTMKVSGILFTCTYTYTCRHVDKYTTNSVFRTLTYRTCALS